MFAAMPGCNLNPPDAEKSKDSDRVAVWGHVSRHGLALADGVILFLPLEANRGDMGAGMIQPDGRYDVRGSHNENGLPPGRYRILIQPRDVAIPITSNQLPRSSGCAAQPVPNHSQPTDSSSIAAGPRIPIQYARPETSNLEVRIDRGPSRVDVDLRD
jgi:hypothetical protein